MPLDLRSRTTVTTPNRHKLLPRGSPPPKSPLRYTTQTRATRDAHVYKPALLLAEEGIVHYSLIRPFFPLSFPFLLTSVLVRFGDRPVEPMSTRSRPMPLAPPFISSLLVHFLFLDDTSTLAAPILGTRPIRMANSIHRSRLRGKETWLWRKRETVSVMQPIIVIGESSNGSPGLAGSGGTEDRSRLTRLNYHANLLIVIAQSFERSRRRKSKRLPLPYSINYKFILKTLLETLSSQKVIATLEISAECTVSAIRR
ncbi:hypothetical protein V8E52_009400 [Russula decolorans]